MKSNGLSMNGTVANIKFSDVEIGQKFTRLVPGFSREYTKNSETTARIDMSFYDADIDANEIVEAQFVANK
jgi:hypothetical protein